MQIISTLDSLSNTETVPTEVPDSEEWHNEQKIMKSVEELPLHEGFIKDGMNCVERFGKRSFDVLVAAVCLIAFSPLFLYCYILIKREGDGPVIFGQTRIGKNGRPFRIYKFRTMTPNAEASGVPQLFNQEYDPRVTRVGAILRKHHLDELPQLWNVFIGDMAFVGPRPERMFFIKKIIAADPRYEYLYQIRPGVTSYATLYNGYTDTLEKMLRRLHYDLYYLEHRSFRFDCKILWRTFWHIARGDEF